MGEKLAPDRLARAESAAKAVPSSPPVRGTEVGTAEGAGGAPAEERR
jgi:hypothetical protein